MISEASTAASAAFTETRILNKRYQFEDLLAAFLLRLRARLRDFLAEYRPTALICVDYYGFNRRVLPLAKMTDVPAYYFVSPQVWASRPGR